MKWDHFLHILSIYNHEASYNNSKQTHMVKIWQISDSDVHV